MVFSSAGNLSDENLFEMQYSSYTNPQTSDDNFFAFQGPAHQIESVKKYNGGNLGGGWGFLPPSEKLDRFMKERGEGVRYAVSILKVGEETFAGDIIVADPSKPYPSMYSGKAYCPSVLCPDNRFSWGSNNSIKCLLLVLGITLDCGYEIRDKVSATLIHVFYLCPCCLDIFVRYYHPVVSVLYPDECRDRDECRNDQCYKSFLHILGFYCALLRTHLTEAPKDFLSPLPIIRSGWSLMMYL